MADRAASELKAHALNSFRHEQLGCNGAVFATAEYTPEEGLRYRVGCDECSERLVVHRRPPLRLSERELVTLGEEALNG
jgi:hypothetical protein